MLLKIDKEKKVWVTSDTHYAQNNICRGVTRWRTKDGEIPIRDTRDFPTLEKMNNTIVNNINEVVGQEDILIHLGDFAFGADDNVEIFRNRIICQEIHLVLGNHDTRIERNLNNCQRFFTSVNDFLRVEYMFETLEMMHYPILSWAGLRKGRIHVHGHSHLDNNSKINFRRYDAGLDGHPEFRPYDLHREIIIPMLKQPIGSELGSNDHHITEFK